MQVFDSEIINGLKDMPLLLTGLYFLGGMSLYLSAVYWLGRFAFGDGHPLSQRQVSMTWMARVFAACAIFSLGFMAYRGILLHQPLRALPEISVLLILSAFYMLAEKRRFLKRRQILKNRLPGELVKIAGVTLVSLGMLMVAAGLIHLLSPLPQAVSVLAAGALFVTPAAALYWRAKERDAGEDLRIRHLLFPVLLVCMLLALPAVI
jgi:hypothetical protein